MQKFQKGDFVLINKEMPEFMKHFPSGCIAIVQGSYNDLCHATVDNNIYEVKFISDYNTEVRIIRAGDSSSWYDEDQLTFIGKTGIELSDWFRDK